MTRLFIVGTTRSRPVPPSVPILGHRGRPSRGNSNTHTRLLLRLSSSHGKDHRQQRDRPRRFCAIRNAQRAAPPCAVHCPLRLRHQTRRWETQHAIADSTRFRERRFASNDPTRRVGHGLATTGFCRKISFEHGLRLSHSIRTWLYIFFIMGM